MFVSFTYILLATFVSTAIAAPLELRNADANELEIRGPTSKPVAPKAGATKKTCTPKTAKASGKKRSVLQMPKRSLFDQVVDVFRRDNKVFIGWHGTNENTAKLWAQHGSIVKPAGGAGTSGLDAELGPGLYITDTLSVGEAAAAVNSAKNKVPGKVCAIYAKSRTAWVDNVFKAQIPESLRGNGDDKEVLRKRYLGHVSEGHPGVGSAAKLGPLSIAKNQMLIPEALNPSLEATCFDIDAKGDSADAKALGASVSYTSEATITEWRIIKANEELATNVKDADAMYKKNKEETCVVL
jgi:hypothetical protein